jgi:hypothetical protein
MGCLNIRAEIIPFEPARVIPGREEENPHPFFLIRLSKQSY